MVLSLRFKAVLPGLIFGVMLLLFLGMTHFALSKASRTTERLAGRFGEIEEVRKIETALSRLVLPHVEYLVSYDPAVRGTVRSQFAALVETTRHLSDRAAANPKERDFLQMITKHVLAAQDTSTEFFTLGPSEHHHAMGVLSKLSTQQIEPLTQSLQLWHENELLEVERLKADTQQALAHIIDWSVVLIFGAAAAMLFAMWFLNNIVVRPIMSLSRAAAVLASGNLKEHAPVYYNDEIGQLAMSMNAMAESLDDLYARMNRMANSDQLTGLLNRRGFEEIAEHELGAARRYGRRFAVVILDVDHFKQVNDTYGHAAGDAVLKFIAERCLATVRESDYCFRYGGEEFVFLLHENTRENVLSAVERCRQSIEQGVCHANGVEIRVTASFGIACFPHGGDDISTLLHNADKALYAAKVSGRNRCITYQHSNEDD